MDRSDRWRRFRITKWRPTVRKRIRHPELGDLTIDWDAFQWAGDTNQQLIVWIPEPGSATEEKSRILSSWIAQPQQKTTTQQDSL